MKKITSLALVLTPLFLLAQTSVKNLNQSLEQEKLMKQVKFKSLEVEGVTIAYREAGNPQNPTIVLLHGFPSSSHQYRKVLNQLSNEFH